MKRKLVKQGSSTLMVSLPSKWIKRVGLVKGDEIEMEAKGDKITVKSEEGKKEKSTKIDLSVLTESSIRTAIVNTYRLGYDKIKIQFKKKGAIKIISDVVKKHLIGFEIIERKGNYCLIENITEPSKERFNDIFNKIILNIEELFNILKKRLNNNKIEFKEIESNIQKFDNFCRRIISKENVHEKNLLKWAFHSELIHAQRNLYLILKYLEKNKIKIKNEKFPLFEKTRTIFGHLKDAYLKEEFSLLEKIHEMEKRIIYKKGYRELENSKYPVINYHLLSAIRGFYLCTSPLIGYFISHKKDHSK